MTFFPIDQDLRPIAEKKLHHVQIIGMVLPNICMSQDMFCIFMWSSVETCINHKNSSSNLDLKTCFLRIYISFSFVSYRQSMCLFFFFHHWGLCFLGGHNYSLSRQNGGLIWGFPKWLKRCMGVVTSHCVSLELLGSKKCVSFFFHFCAKYAHMCIDENLAWFNQSCNFFSTNIYHWPSVYATFLKFKLNLKYIFYSIGNKSTCRFSVIFCQNTLPPPTTALLIPVKEREKRLEEKLPQVRWETMKNEVVGMYLLKSG